MDLDPGEARVTTSDIITQNGTFSWLSLSCDHDYSIMRWLFTRRSTRLQHPHRHHCYLWKNLTISQFCAIFHHTRSSDCVCTIHLVNIKFWNLLVLYTVTHDMIYSWYNNKLAVLPEFRHHLPRRNRSRLPRPRHNHPRPQPPHRPPTHHQSLS